jgi:hypothetical protein
MTPGSEKDQVRQSGRPRMAQDRTSAVRPKMSDGTAGTSP